MPSYNDYTTLLQSEATSLVGFAVGTRRDVDKIIAETRRRVIQKRNQLTLDITRRWKEGFAALKKENDQMQVDLAAAYRATEQYITELKADLYERAQK